MQFFVDYLMNNLAQMEIYIYQKLSRLVAGKGNVGLVYSAPYKNQSYIEETEGQYGWMFVIESIHILVLFIDKMST